MEERPNLEGRPLPQLRMSIRRKPVAGHDSPIAVEYMPYRSPLESTEEDPFAFQYMAYRSPVENIEEEPVPDITAHQYVPYRSPGDGPMTLHPTIHRRPSVTRRNTERGRRTGGSFSTGSVNRVSMRASVSNYSDYGVSPISPVSPSSQLRRPSTEGGIHNISRNDSLYDASIRAPRRQPSSSDITRPSAAETISSAPRDANLYQTRSSGSGGRRMPLSPLMELSAQEAAHWGSFESESSAASVAPLSPRDTLTSTRQLSKRRGGRSDTLSRDIHYNWLPMTLRWHFMIVLFLISLGLGALALALTIQSQKNQGLGTDHGSSLLFFAWRFIPTILAVIYGILTSAMLLDIKRTEPYARLSRPDGASAASSLFLTFRMIWYEPFDALTKSRNDGFRNWGLFWALIINLIALLLITPFSSAFLSSRSVLSRKNTSFSGLLASLNSPVQFSADESSLLRTAASVILNTSTSPWITEDYVVIPSYPSDLGSVSSDAVFSESGQQWTVQSTIYQAGLACTPMTLQNYANFSLTRQIPSPAGITVYSTINLTSFILQSADGCSFGFAEFPLEYSPNSIFEYGGGWWSGGPTFSYPPNWSPSNGTDPGLSDNYPFMLNTTSQCRGRDIFFIASPSSQSKFQAQGQVCTSTYYSATLPVTVATSGSSSKVTFEDSAFEISKTPVSVANLNITSFENTFLQQDWSTRFKSPDLSSNTYIPSRPNLGGPLALLGAQNNFNLQQMMSSSSLADQAQQAKQRFFGESILAEFSALDDSGNAQTSISTGQVASVERRIVVSFVAGILLTAAFLLSSLMIVLVIGYTRLNERPLNISEDPSSTMAIASLIGSGQNTRVLFEGMDTTSQGWMQKSLARNIFYVRHGILYSYDVRDTYQHSGKPHP